MKKETRKYTDEFIGKLEAVPDFLPKPKDLVLKHETVKVTLSLTKDSIEFFKDQAEKHHGHYQAMIRNLLDEYAHRHHDR